MSKIVVALGGNALQKNGEASAVSQERVAKETVRQLMPLIKAGNQIVIVHGNGPQVGNIVLHEESINTEATPTMPLHSCVAMTQGMIGYWLQKAFFEEFKKENLNKNAVSLVTQIEVSADDPAFQNPTKPIGPFYQADEVDFIRREKGYVLKEDSGRGYRRVVPSPKPVEIIEKSVIDKLFTSGDIVIAAGGGGVAIRKNGDFDYSGVDAVIDKDFAAELLASEINADILLILTAVDNAMVNFGKENQEIIEKISVERAEKYIEEGQFGAGSMLPKIEACIKFAKKGKKSIITSLENAEKAIFEDFGTVIE